MEKYRDIINLPHHVSSTRPQMSMLNRAAQFSPFAALTGYDDAIEETARLTDSRITARVMSVCLSQSFMTALPICTQSYRP